MEEESRSDDDGRHDEKSHPKKRDNTLLMVRILHSKRKKDKKVVKNPRIRFLGRHTQEKQH
jgi:hypothetical protein